MIFTRLLAIAAGAAITLAAWAFLAPLIAPTSRAQAAAISASPAATTNASGKRERLGKGERRNAPAARNDFRGRSGSSQRRAAEFRGSGLDGVGRGAQTRKYSSRGAASRSAMQRAGYGNAAANVDQ